MLKRADSWLNIVTKIVGLLGLAYETLGDHLKNPTAIVVFGGLAGVSDVLGWYAQQRQGMREELEDMYERREGERREGDRRAGGREPDKEPE